MDKNPNYELFTVLDRYNSEPIEKTNLDPNTSLFSIICLLNMNVLIIVVYMAETVCSCVYLSAQFTYLYLFLFTTFNALLITATKHFVEHTVKIIICFKSTLASIFLYFKFRINFFAFMIIYIFVQNYCIPQNILIISKQFFFGT